MRWGWAAGALALMTVQACSLVKPVTPPVVDGHQRGVASWYGPGFHGRRTANGEVYDQYELTAAHQTLPLGTRVLVTSLTNGRSVEVRINDRGPFIDGRVIDLSYGAARVIDMIGPGVMPVRVEVLDTPVLVASRTPTPVVRRPRPAATDIETPGSDAGPRRVRSPTIARRDAAPGPSPASEGQFALLVATLSDGRKAEHLRSRLAIKFPEAHVSPLDVGVDRHYRVKVGPFPSREAAVARATLVNRYGYPAVITDETQP
jgi:rare lipoprotein A